MVVALHDLYQAPAADLTLPTFNRSVAAITWINNLHIFAVEPGTRNLITKYWFLDTRVSTAVINLGGNFTGDPIPVALESGELIIFARFSDDALWYQISRRELWYSRQLPWIQIGGRYASSFAVVKLGSTSVNIFGRGHDGAIYHTSFHDRATMSLGGSFVSQPAAVSWGPGRLDVFARGTDDAIWWKAWNGSTWSSDWRSLGGSFVSAPTVVSKDVGRLTVFGIHPNGGLLTKYFDHGAWSSQWNDLGGNLSTTIAVHISATDSGRKRYDVFAVDREGVLSQITSPGSGWLSWVKFPGKSLVSAPAISDQRYDRLDLFALNSQHGLVLYNWNETRSPIGGAKGTTLGGNFINFSFL